MQPSTQPTLLCLTGGIGTGKSKISDFLKEKGWKTICTDEIVHQLYQPNQTIPRLLAKEFGPSVLAQDGSVNRAQLGKIVFESEAARQRLNQIVHPEVRKTWMGRSAEFIQQGKQTVVVIPLAYETNVIKEFNAVWVVACNAETQKERLRGRGLSDADIERRIQAQWPLQKKVDLADAVIWNNADWSLTERQITLLLQQLL
jgi:dephospho-CoA kinase